MDRYIADNSMQEGTYMSGGIALYCRQGWTRVYQNTFYAHHDDVTFTESGGSCTCPGSGINNNNGAHSSSGWHVGVTGCPSTNALFRTISGQRANYAYAIDPDMPNVGPVSAIRHTGVNHEDHGYDHTDWTNKLISTSPMEDDGEFGSAVKDASGDWQWFARYSLGSYSLEKTMDLSYPYFSFMYSSGGPPACDESNSDGFDMKDWEIWVK